jgi:fatty acid-binding protein DegV
VPSVGQEPVWNTDKVHIFDSRSASIGETLSAAYHCAGEMLQAGHSILHEILQQLEKDRDQNAFAYFTIDSLTHLVKGGRLTKTQGFVGSVLNIKPILRSPPKEPSSCRKGPVHKKSPANYG